VEEEEDVEEEVEPWLVPAEPLRLCREEVRRWWSRTTDENGAPALRACECPGATLSANVIAPAASESVTARRKRVCAPKRRRSCRKLATDAPSAAIAGIGEGSGMRRV